MDLKEIYNQFTRECDEHIMKELKHNKLFTTYLIEWDPKQTGDEFHRQFAIRVPGATRGCLYVEKETGLISNIVFDDYTSFHEKIGCYEKSIRKLIPKWIGKKL